MRRALRKLVTPRVFYLHFNRIAMQRGDPKVWSIRTSRGCFHAERVMVQTHVETVYKPRARQPRAFFRGRGFGYWVELKSGGKVFLLTSQPLPTED